MNYFKRISFSVGKRYFELDVIKVLSNGDVENMTGNVNSIEDTIFDDISTYYYGLYEIVNDEANFIEDFPFSTSGMKRLNFFIKSNLGYSGPEFTHDYELCEFKLDATVKKSYECKLIKKTSELVNAGLLISYLFSRESWIPLKKIERDEKLLNVFPNILIVKEKSEENNEDLLSWEEVVDSFFSPLQIFMKDIRIKLFKKHKESESSTNVSTEPLNSLKEIAKYFDYFFRIELNSSYKDEIKIITTSDFDIKEDNTWETIVEKQLQNYITLFSYFSNY